MKQTSSKKNIVQPFGSLGIDVGQEHMAICLKISDDPVFKFYLFSFIDPLKKNVPYCTKLKQLHEQLENVYQHINELINKRYKDFNGKIINSKDVDSKDINSKNVDNKNITSKNIDITEFIKNIHIEQQVVEVNIKYQYAIMMWFVIKGFKIFPQQPSIKYQFMDQSIRQQADIHNQSDSHNQINSHNQSDSHPQTQQQIEPQQQFMTALTYRQNSMNKIKGQYYVMVNYIDNNLVDIVYQSEFGKNSSKHTKTGKVKMCRWYSENTRNFVQKYDIDKLDDIADSLLIVLASSKKSQ